MADTSGTTIGGVTFLAQDDPADWETGGAALDRSVSLLEQVGTLIRGAGPNRTAEMDDARDEVGADG